MGHDAELAVVAVLLQLMLTVVLYRRREASGDAIGVMVRLCNPPDPSVKI